ncbi:MAG: hypothetical protein ACREA9_24915 [Pyrinomonadaceae bacterium]
MLLNSWRIITVNFFVGLLLFFGNMSSASDARDYFKITVVDDATGRGVPLVELKTTSEVRYYTDSNGVVAFYESALMDRDVFFYVRSHGYEFIERFDEERGKVLKVTRGGSALLKLKRLNIAERLYRITGEGIYRDSVLVGHPVPIKHPLLNGKVMGQDSIIVAPYRAKLYWFWGDTTGPADFNGASSGATSKLPGKGGLDPSVGIDLTYFVNESGFSKPMCPLPDPGLVWIFWMLTLPDDKGNERLIAGYSRIKDLDEAHERVIGVFNDQTESFEPLARLDVSLKEPTLAGHPFRGNAAGEDYFYFAGRRLFTRIKADLEHLADPKTYESFTPLAAGSRYEKAATKLDRSSDGRLIYSWKANTDAVNYQRQEELIVAGKMKPEEALWQLLDSDTGEAIAASPGSVFWNDFRERWVMLVERDGQVWYAEGDTFVGPWVYARKIVTHDRYSFYNVTQHPYFDQDGGRLIYFEGTYTGAFVNLPDITPRYNYNQIMYRLALDDPRLALPVPVYRIQGTNGAGCYLLREDVDAQDAWGRVEEAAFFALPPNCRREGLIPIYATPDDKEPPGGIILQRGAPVGKADQQPLFYALPMSDGGKEVSPVVIPLYEYRHGESGARFYSTRPDLENKKIKRTAQPVCRVWRNPMSSLILDHQTRSVGPVKK